jgi:hypothetical protein
MDNPRDPLNQLTQSTIEDRSDGKRPTSNVQDGPEEIPVAKRHEESKDDRLALSAEQIAFAKVLGRILAERWAEEMESGRRSSSPPQAPA